MTKGLKAGFFRLVTALMVAAGPVAELSSEDGDAQEPSAEVARIVVARVNGQPIYEDQVSPAVEQSLGKLTRHGARKGDPSLVRRLQARVLDKAIGNLLINQESKKRTIENMDEKVDQRVKDLEQKYGAGQGMERYLKIRKSTLGDLREGLKRRVKIDEYLKEQGVLEPEIPEERIREMYDADPDSFSTTEAVTVSHILISADAHAGTEKKEQARQKAEQIREEILEGKDFDEMAKKHSDCNSASGGGNLGRVRKGHMPAEFEKVAFPLKKDAVSEVVETRFGYHVIKVVDKHPAHVVPYEQMRGFLKKYLQDEESKKKLASHIEELKKRAEIEIMLK